MAETSRIWDGTDTGDANGSAPYDAKTQLAEMYMTLVGADANASLSGVSSWGDQLDAASGINEVVVSSGKAVVWGTFYKNDDDVHVVIPTPVTSTRVDVIVLRKEWDAQLVRIQRVAGTEGGGVPALTQDEGVEWETPLWNASITTGAVITLTDRREYLAGAISEDDPSTLEFGGAADPGVSSNPSAGDHEHAMPEAYRLFVKPVDTSRTAVTLVVDPVLIAPVLLNHLYRFSAMLVFTESVSGTDICFDVVAPGGSTMVAHAYGLDTADAFAFKTLVNTDGWGAPGTVFIEGLVDVGADGNLELRWGSKVNTGGNITLKTNSSLLVMSDV